MNYKELRAEIRGTVDAILNPYNVHVSDMALEQIMTAIDTYLEEKAVECEEKKYVNSIGYGKKGFNRGIDKAATIIRSEE